MTEYSVGLEATTAAGMRELELAIDAAGQALRRHSAEIGSSPGRIEGRLNLESVGPSEAAAMATSIFAAHLPIREIVRVDVMTAERWEKAVDEVNFPDLRGVSEVAEMLQVSRQRVAQLATTHPTFPPPVIQLAAGPVWLANSISRFADTWSRKGGRPSRAETVAKRERTAARRRAIAAVAGSMPNIWTRPERKSLRDE